MTASTPQYVGRISRRNYDRASRNPEIQAMIHRAACHLGWEPHVLYCREPYWEYSRFHGLSAAGKRELWEAIREPDRFPKLDAYRKVMLIAFELEWKWRRRQALQAGDFPSNSEMFDRSASEIDRSIRDAAAWAAASWYVRHQRIPWLFRHLHTRKQQRWLINACLTPAT